MQFHSFLRNIQEVFVKKPSFYKSFFPAVIIFCDWICILNSPTYLNMLLKHKIRMTFSRIHQNPILLVVGISKI